MPLEQPGTVSYLDLDLDLAWHSSNSHSLNKRDDSFSLQGACTRKCAAKEGDLVEVQVHVQVEVEVQV